MPAKKTSAETLLEQLEHCTEETLAELDQQIGQEETALAELTAKREGKIAALKHVRRIIDVRLHGKPPRKKPGRKAKGASAAAAVEEEPADDGQSATDGDKPLAERIYDLIFEKGPLPYGQIGAALGRHATAIRWAATKSDWFEVHEGVVSIAQAK